MNFENDHLIKETIDWNIFISNVHSIPKCEYWNVIDSVVWNISLHQTQTPDTSVYKRNFSNRKSIDICGHFERITVYTLYHHVVRILGRRSLKWTAEWVQQIKCIVQFTVKRILYNDLWKFAEYKTSPSDTFN